ncbi:phosphonate ABC transporter ATP-binding protein [Pseudonocardia parietis]|uniref:Phosphonate transport system ATP-binding protein n=1 Tax=Pseudonocardia parietis TaxID=570936 RepID=A0ABS4W6G2_9PSEU|nr:phosphonate ABC transporter ATP-binding protein [Pseudonocardia parietis]MBP2371797.1 phosphonate transport system ATP-binding protein [Pseudonocardia parietis]
MFNQRSFTAPMYEKDDPVLEISGLTKRFAPDVHALDDVSLTVRPGENVAVLGLSGSGKSTLLRHVNGLHRPTSGTVRVLGTDVGTASSDELRRLRSRVGFVFQQFHLVGSVSVLENVCTGALGGLRGPRLGLISYPRRVRRAALEQLDRVGLADQRFQRADTLSGGQQQRVAVARALLQRPRILLADEPVASLDPESSAQVMALIADVSREDGLTVVCSLHQVEVALSFGERIVGLRSGQIVLDQPAAATDRCAAMAVYGGMAEAAAVPVAAAR